ncbi:MAG: HAD family hydrolase [Candidatus Aenigmarchaeota archaeon]|nr:HAD family hydrolase [Candidatus Aenigmarchaeota archaeon]
MIKAVVFDLDGVIVDSEREHYVTALDAFRGMGGKIERNEKSWAAFREARKFILVAEDYWPVLKAVQEENIDFSKMAPAGFAGLKRKYKNSREFVLEFYLIRKERMGSDFAKWLEMHALYEGVKETITELERRCPVLIVTARDSDSALKLLRHFGIGMEKERILGREEDGGKADHLRRIAERMKIRASEILFIEDLVENAIMAKEIGVKAALVEWGYGGKEQIEKAVKLGIPIIRRGNVKRQVERLMKSN